MTDEVFIFPASSGQQRLWFLSQLETNGAAYNIPAAVRLKGALDVAALRKSLDEVVRRHETLRTCFRVLDGDPAQVISPALTLDVPLLDLGHLPEAEREAEALRSAAEEARRPFDLSNAPLLRARLLRLRADDHLLTLTLHHIIADGWSAGVLVREVAALYGAFAAGRPSPLDEPAVQYADFAHWEQERLSDEFLSGHMAYWERKLAGELPVLELPADRPRPRVPSGEGRQLRFELPHGLTGSLRALARAEGVTLFMAVLAAFKVLLSRYTGQEDVVVGVPNANRNLAETERLIGLFVNTLVLRTDLSGDPSFRELLGRVRETVVGADAHREMPFEKLVERLEPGRELDRHPLFQVMFVFQGGLMSPPSLPGLELSLLDVDAGTAKFDLLVSVLETKGGLACVIQYSTDLFDEPTMRRLAGHYENLLRGAASEPWRPISELPLLSEEERRTLLEGWNRTGADYPRDLCLHQLFERQAAATPDADAVVDGAERLTYAQLDERAEGLARLLRARGVGPESLVGLLVGRGAKMVAAVLGVLKAGGAYVPLDPEYPRDRLRFMLEDSGARLLLAGRELYERVWGGEEEGPEAELLLMEEAWRAAAQAADEVREEAVPHRPASPANLAYVIYTSGSTGRPKGVAIEHRSAVALVSWARDLFGPERLWRVLASTSLCFDLSVFELFAPLSAGGAAVVAENALQLPALAAAAEVTMVNTVPSAMAELLRAGGVPGSVRAVNLAGEALGRPLVEEVYAQTRAEEVWNLYGPTEDTTYSTYALVGRGEHGAPAIGRPVSNSRAYVLDGGMRLVPAGVAGELWLGGEGLARCYLGRPALTADRFRPDPFGPSPGGRLYRTGDLVRWSRGGELEYVGRMDQQVKLRGYRLELGEVEACLREDAHVLDCVAAVAEGAGGDRQLVAYVVARGAEEPEPSPLSSASAMAEAGADALGAELRERARARLPHYMVPGWVEVLGALPLTPNGKVDRRRLPRPKRWGADGAGSAGRRMTAVEEVVAGAWREVLGVGEVGAEEDFFALGGHSLLATRVVSRLREVFRVELPLRAMFETPTVAGLAKSIELARRGGEASQPPPITRADRGGEIPLSFSQQRLWFLDELQPGSPFYNLSTALRIEGPLDVSALRRAFEEIVRRHESLRTTFAGVDGRPVQVISPDARPSLPLTDLGGVAEPEREAEARRLAEEESQLPFDLARGPLLRARLLRLRADDHLLLLTMHHIISDGWSKGVLMRELTALYRAFAEGRPSPLAELAVQYADFAVWQREWLRGETLARQLEYWKRQLAGAPTVLELPTDRPRPAVQTFRGATHNFELPPDLAAGLSALSRREGVTLFMTLLAGFSALLSRHTGQEDFVVGTAIANREQVATEDLIGMFVNTLPLRVDTSGDPEFGGLLERVRAVALDAYAHQSLPFEKLIDELQLKRDTSRSPLVQVMLILQNAPSDRPELPGLKLTPVVGEGRAAKLDLILSITQDGGALRCALEYNTDLFKEATVGRLAGHFRTLLEGAAADPRRRLSDLPLMTDGERRQLAQWNATRAEYDRDRCVHELFEEQAERMPDAPALTYEDETLTYAELNRRANQLARRLRALGVGPEVRVGICVERSAEMVVGLLAILKAGGAYVPMDVDYPRERLSFMLEDARVGVLLTKEALLPNLPAHRARPVCLDSDWGEIGALDGGNFDGGARPENLAYVIYTSGSTGRPKGVMIPHRNVAHLFAAVYPALGLGGGEVWTLFHSYAFDFSVWELWGALLHGARLVIVPVWTARTPEAFRELLASQRVTVLSQTPTAFNQWTGADAARAFEGLSLRLLVLGGEALPYELAHRLSGAPFPVWNFYGPTEATVWTAIHRLAPGEESPNSIGRPFARMQLHILDRRGAPVPVGVVGELHIGGEGLARGYLQRPALTAEKFVPHPFSAEPGARLYRTGDLARRLPDGRVDFLGRTDDQVKVRGYRIEPGEIEAALSEDPAVREAVVVAREGSAGEQRLVAYVVEKQGRRLSVEGLRAALKERLPGYMVPGVFVVLDELPVTPNGKIDRRALPAPGSERSEPGHPFTPPETAAEVALAGAWERVLGLGRVGVHDNFFDLGGDSIRCIQARAETQKRGFDFSVQQLFQHQTVFELARHVTAFGADGRQEARTRPFDLVPAAERARLPEAVEDAYPLAKLQQGMLFHSELSPDAAVYHDILTFHLRAPFDPEALRSALAGLFARHAVLRTAFDLVNFGEPLQMVLGSVEVPLSHSDLRHLPADEQEARLAAWVEAEKRNRFEWDRPPYLRFAVFRRSEETFQFALSFHHAVLDGWSLASLLTELFALYSARLRGAEPGRELPPPPPGVTFRDFVALEREAVESAECRGYWEGKLAGAAATTWPDGDADEGGEARPRSYEAEFAPEFVGRLREFARLAGVPLKSVLLAAHLKVVGVLGGSEDVLTGLVSNGRPEGAGGERALGLFLNTVPLSVRLSGGTWLDLARAAHAAEQEMFPFRRYPLAELQKECGGRPLFESTFNFTHFHVVEALRAFEDLEVLGADAFGRTNFPVGISFTLDPGTSRLTLHIVCDEGKADEERMQAAGDYFRRVLDAMTGDPLARYETYSPLPEEELRKVCVEWGEGEAVGQAGGLCLHESFERQAALTPSAVAVVCGDERLTYGELNARANRLARHLVARGARPESPVAVLLERSAQAVVALLAVFKVGAAYVPLDPAYPPRRLGFMLEDSGAVLLLTSGALAAAASESLSPESGSRARLILLDEERELIAGRGGEDLPGAARPEGLAYVIYTSGSTGRPKGVGVTHGSLAAVLSGAARRFAPAPGDVMPCLASFAFDISLFELFLPLLGGGAALLAGRDLVPDVPRLVAALAAEGVTLLHAVPSLMRRIVEEADARVGGDGERRLAPRRLFVGGDVVAPELLRRMCEVFPGAEVEVLYGPTEATIICAAYGAGAGRRPRRSVMGRPLPGARLHVLDGRGQVAPAGVAGEVYVGGEGVARGYVGRPALTAERFTPDPFSGRPGARLYRTGDLGRWGREGALEFIGRADGQVKVRGHRVELGEVEAALRAQEGVRDAAVLALDEGGETRLVAYVVPRDGAEAEASAAELRRRLKERLPNYMIPSAFVCLDALPMSPNGKLDRRALPAPEGGRDDSLGEYVAPRNMTEEMVAGIWQELLKVERVGVRDDFFDLGGHSLLVTQVVSRLRETFRVELPLRWVFENPTVESLSARLEARRREGAGPSAPPIDPVPRGGELELSYAQQRLWFLHQMEPESPAFNIPVAVRLAGRLDVDALRRTLEEVYRRHEVLRTVFDIAGGRAVQVVRPPSPLPLPLTDLSGEAGRDGEARRLAREEARKPFDLRRGPLVRASLLRLGEREHVLLLTMHHIVSDAWSIGVLLRETAALYESFRDGRPSPLAELPVQYADYAAWQRRWLSGEALSGQLEYWAGRLGGGLPAMNLPADRERPALPSFRGAAHPFSPPAELSRELKALSRRRGVTPFMTLLACFKLLLFHHTESADVVVGANVAGRTRAETESLIGFFVNMLALRTDLSGDPTFAELLSRVRETALGAYAHQDVPFEKVLEELKVERLPARSPLQVAFTFDNTPREAVELPELSLELLDAEMETTRLDLVLDLSDGPGGLAGSFQYSTDLFDAATVARLAAHYELLLRLVVEQPDARLSGLRASLAEAERERQAARREEFREARSRALRDAKLKRVPPRSSEGELVR